MRSGVGSDPGSFKMDGSVTLQNGRIQGPSQWSGSVTPQNGRIQGPSKWSDPGSFKMVSVHTLQNDQDPWMQQNGQNQVSFKMVRSRIL